MANSFCHVELASDDPVKAKEFYSKLLDWKFEDYPMEEGNYVMIDPGKDPKGGIFQNPVPGVPSHWLVYIDVEDIEAANTKVVELGGTVVKEITPVEQMGKFSVIQDPTGAVIALWQAEKK